jgi:hypothetical protein
MSYQAVIVLGIAAFAGQIARQYLANENDDFDV